MNELKIKLENCYGIKKLEKKFTFTTEHNVNVIYAKNGLMKTSFAKVFKKFQDGKEREIEDLIFGNLPINKEIQIDETDILKEEIFVINSFEKAYESESISSLLIDDNLKDQLEDVLDLRLNILKNLEKKSGLKISKVSLGKTIFELEPKIIDNFNFEENSFLRNLNVFILPEENNYLSNIKYMNIFDESVLNKKIKSYEFQNKIDDYLTKSDEIYASYKFLEKGKFTLPKLKDIQKKLKGNNFFVKNNKVLFNGSVNISTITELNDKIKEIENELQGSSEFKAIEKLLSDVKGMALKDTIEKYPEIIGELKLTNLEKFRKKLWFSYLKEDEENFNNLKVQYALLKEKIDELDIDDTPWKEAIDIFNARFNLPFKMDIDNLTSSIIGESLPKIIFSFCDKENHGECEDTDWIKLNRDELENNDTLSQGEKRALYLLNIIFDIEKRKKDNQKTLFIIDDIADSFDYRNKYAIIEYLKDITKEDYFYMIILSHNFDFYRTISSRLDLNWDKKFHAIKTNGEIKIEKEHYQNKPFDTWKDVMSAGRRYNIDYNDIDAKKHILALIPFTRNLIEYGVDKQVNTFHMIEKDYLLLTNLLHLKNETKEIDVEQLKIIYGEYLGKNNFDTSISDSDKVYDLIVNIADNNISNDNINLENKIILAIAIRLKAEEYMKKKIKSSLHTFNWKNNSGNQEEFLNHINSKGNQTRELFNGFIQIEQDEAIKILESVNIMTPENIHLNSFMYEPLLDMDIVELKSLYDNVKSL